MPWSNWIELPFFPNGTLNTEALRFVPATSGVYAIASKKSTGLFVTHYVGRSVRSVRGRLQRHLTGQGNKVIATQLVLKQSVPAAPASICVAFLETREPKIVEAVYLDTKDIPVCNLIKAKLPQGLSDALVMGSELERG